MSDQQRPPLKRVGAAWKSTRPNSKSFGTGSLTINGLKQRFVIVTNDRKAKETDPDYYLMASSEPEVDQYARSERRAEAVN